MTDFDWLRIAVIAEAIAIFLIAIAMIVLLHTLRRRP